MLKTYFYLEPIIFLDVSSSFSVSSVAAIPPSSSSPFRTEWAIVTVIIVVNIMHNMTRIFWSYVCESKNTTEEEIVYKCA